MRGWGLGFGNPGGTWGKWDMSLYFGCGGVGGVRGVGGLWGSGWATWDIIWEGGVVLCMCVL